MKKFSWILPIALFAACAGREEQTAQQQDYHEPHRPQVHFSPKRGWMNDPNGMVYFNGTYHLFFQHNPDSTVWGPMHWGHATSKDLVHWAEQPIALYPDSLGTIFSGSAVVDANNTTGFGKQGQIPLVAIFTHHNTAGEKAGRADFQTQSLAYSVDEGKTWTKYSGNPVLRNPGIRDFRDPKVSWFEPGKNWIMTLATSDHISFYSSPNLKDWTKESEFGKEMGAHGGVWECPDLFTLDYKGEKIWVLVVNLNPGGPNQGSATQYFTGQFDGHRFTPNHTGTKWLDYGPDEYAGITWSNTGDRKIFLGWMSNWQYAGVVPTGKWRSALTIPRELGLEKTGNDYLVVSRPVKELDLLAEKSATLSNITATTIDLTQKTGKLSGPARIDITSDKLESFTLTLSNDAGEKLLIGYDKAANNYFIDRRMAGEVQFEKGFAAKHTAPRFTGRDPVDLTLILDNASVELFADGGLTVMTEIFFPQSPFSSIRLQSGNRFKIKSLQVSPMKSSWQ
ncbi:MAG: glycoside hydrolase family 32 protein [Williamsia sp.]|nr:glycoside hydrolase family 32 protein [Williamsia sp.]